MRFEIDDGVCDQLAGTMESGLAATHGFEELGIAAIAEEILLLRRYCANFAATARIDRLELSGDDMRCWSGRRTRVRLVSEESLYYRVLEFRGFRVCTNTW